MTSYVCVLYCMAQETAFLVSVWSEKDVDVPGTCLTCIEVYLYRRVHAWLLHLTVHPIIQGYYTRDGDSTIFRGQVACCLVLRCRPLRPIRLASLAKAVK